MWKGLLTVTSQEGLRPKKHQNESKTTESLTESSKTVTTKTDPSFTPTVATSSTLTPFAPLPGIFTETGARISGVTLPFALFSILATSFRYHSTAATIFSSHFWYSPNADSAIRSCEPGSNWSVVTVPCFWPSNVEDFNRPFAALD